MKTRFLRWLLQMGYWLMYALLMALFYVVLVFSSQNGSITSDPLWILWIKLMAGFSFVPAIIGFYAAYLRAFTFYQKQKLSHLFLWFLLTAIVGSVAGAICMGLIFQKWMLFNDGWASAFPQLLLMAFITAVNFILGLVIRGFIQSAEDIWLKQVLENERLQLELHLLRTQINPHFVFNSLHHIDILMHQSPQKASTYLHALSEFLRAIVYHSDATYYPLDQEILMLQDYLSLQKMRMAHPQQVQLAVKGNSENGFVPALLFLPIVENCFKHGQWQKIGHSINITIEITDSTIHFSCTNVSEKENDPITEGLGLQLTRKRLTACYQEKSTLNISNKDSLFTVIIRIPIQQ
jgi:two-component system, LytTR family, sensor kinase